MKPHVYYHQLTATLACGIDAAFEVIDAEEEVAVVFDLSGVPTPKN